MVARVLIAQNPDRPTAPEEPDCFLEAFAPVKELDAKASPPSPNEPIEMPVAQFLINGAQARVREVMRKDLGKKLPVAEVTENDHHWSAGAKLAMNFVGPLDRDERHHFLQRHGVQFHPAEEIGPEPLKMTAHDPALLGSGLLRTEGNFHIPAGKLPISRQQD